MNRASDYSRMDEGLRFLSSYGPDLSNGFTNHGPMVTEALSAMGRADAVMPWLTQNWPLRQTLTPNVGSTQAIGDWRVALGNDDPAAWTAFLAQEIWDTRWQDFVARWSQRLAPAIGCAAAHGAIRAGHAVRSLAERETPERLNELARAFGYWAACYETLPVADYAGAPLSAREAIGRVPLSPGPAREQRGSFSAGLRSLHGFPDFAPVIGMIDVRGDPATTLSEMTECFARVYLANARDSYTAIAFIHAVTAPTALRSLLPYLDDARAALRYAWQASSALYSVYAVNAPAWDDTLAPQEPVDSLIASAVATADDHAIKFMEANLREYALNPDPVYLAAANHASGILGEHG